MGFLVALSGPKVGHWIITVRAWSNALILRERKNLIGYKKKKKKKKNDKKHKLKKKNLNLKFF